MKYNILILFIFFFTFLGCEKEKITPESEISKKSIITEEFSFLGIWNGQVVYKSNSYPITFEVSEYGITNVIIPGIMIDSSVFIVRIPCYCDIQDSIVDIYDTQINKDWWISYGSLDRSNNYHFELVKKWNSETIIDLGIYSGIVEK